MLLARRSVALDPVIKSSARATRIAAQMQRSLAELLRRGVKDPRVGNVTVTAVQLAGDLSVARIFFLPFAAGPGTDTDEVLTGLRSAAGFLRGELARELKLRHAPRLEFQLDTDLERAQHLSELIEGAVKTDRTRSAEHADTPAADEDA
jgi:ribosome-binding factor A